MFLERDVLVLQEQAKDRLRLREEDRLAATMSQQGRKSRRQRAAMAVSFLVQKLLPG